MLFHDHVVLAHDLDGFGAEGVHCVHGLEGLVKHFLDLLNAEHRVLGELGGFIHMGIKLAACFGDQALNRTVHAAEHFHHLDLVARGPCHGLRNRQRAHAGGGHAGAAVHHFTPGFLEHVQCQIAVGAHRLLGHHVLQVLPRIKQHLLLQGLGADGIGRLQRIDLGGQLGIQRFCKIDGTREFLHCIPKLGAGGLNVHHIALHVIARFVNLLHAFLQLRSGTLVFAKVRLQLVAKRNHTQNFLRLEQVAFLAGVQVVQVPAHVLNRLEGGAVFNACKVALHEAPLHQAGRDGHLFAPQRKGAVQLGLEGLALHVLLEQALHEAVNLVVHCRLRGFGQWHGGLRDLGQQGCDDFRRRQREACGRGDGDF